MVFLIFIFYFYYHSTVHSDNSHSSFTNSCTFIRTFIKI